VVKHLVHSLLAIYSQSKMGSGCAVRCMFLELHCWALGMGRQQALLQPAGNHPVCASQDVHANSSGIAISLMQQLLS